VSLDLCKSALLLGPELELDEATGLLLDDEAVRDELGERRSLLATLELFRDLGETLALVSGQPRP